MVNGDRLNEGYNATVSKSQITVQAERAEGEFRKIDLEPIKKLPAKTL